MSSEKMVINRHREIKVLLNVCEVASAILGSIVFYTP